MERIIGSIYSDIDRKRMIELIYTGNGGDPALASGEEENGGIAVLFNDCPRNTLSVFCIADA